MSTSAPPLSSAAFVGNCGAPDPVIDGGDKKEVRSGGTRGFLTNPTFGEGLYRQVEEAIAWYNENSEKMQRLLDSLTSSVRGAAAQTAAAAAASFEESASRREAGVQRDVETFEASIANIQPLETDLRQFKSYLGRFTRGLESGLRGRSADDDDTGDRNGDGARRRVAEDGSAASFDSKPSKMEVFISRMQELIVTYRRVKDEEAQRRHQLREETTTNAEQIVALFNEQLKAKEEEQTTQFGAILEELQARLDRIQALESELLAFTRDVGGFAGRIQAPHFSGEDEAAARREQTSDDVFSGEDEAAARREQTGDDVKKENDEGGK